MRFKATWILIAVFAALGAYLTFVDTPRYEARQEAEQKKDLLFPGFDTEQVTELRIDGKAGTVRVKKGEEDKWYLAEPWDDRADDGRVRTLLTDLKDLKGDREVAGADADLKPYGLDAPEAVVEVTGQEAKLAIGKPNPAGDARYVRAGDGPVQVAKSSAVAGFLREPSDLRNKDALVGFPWERLSSVTIRPADGGPLTLRKVDESWRLEAPIEGEADPDAVERLVDKLRWARVGSFLDEDAKRANEALGKGLSVVLAAEGEAKPVTVRLAAVDGAVWADQSGREALFTLNQDVLDAYKVSAEDLRRKRPVLVKAWQVKKLDLTVDGQNLAYAKQDGTWQRGGTPLAAPENTALQDFLKAIEETRADAVVTDPGSAEAYGLAAPAVTASLEDDEGAKTLAVGKAGDAVYARSGENGPVYRMPAAYLEEAETLLQATRPPEKAAAGEDKKEG